MILESRGISSLFLPDSLFYDETLIVMHANCSLLDEDESLSGFDELLLDAIVFDDLVVLRASPVDTSLSMSSTFSSLLTGFLFIVNSLARGFTAWMLGCRVHTLGIIDSLTIERINGYVSTHCLNYLIPITGDLSSDYSDDGFWG